MDCADSSSPLIAQPLWLAPWKDEPYPLKGNVVEQRIKEKAESKLAALDESTSKSDSVISKVIQHRSRYFSNGVVIGSKDFVNSFFHKPKDRFGPKRTTGARKPRGALKWSP